MHTLRLMVINNIGDASPGRVQRGIPLCRGSRGAPFPLYNVDHMFYNSRARDPAYSAAARRHRRSINPERPLQTRRKKSIRKQ